tara:strand:- start:275 stop:1663 length:1389 start_codon:yes stop_codon:yes gene_type:complete
MADKVVLEAEIKSNVGEVTQDTEKLSKETKKASGSFGGLGKAIKGIGGALKAAGIGIVVGLLVKLGDVFRQNQKVLDFFNVAMESLSLAFNDLFKFIDNNIGTITGHLKAIFTDPLNELYKLGQGIQTFFIDNLGGVIDFLGSLGKLIATNPITNPKLFAANLAKVALAANDAKRDIKAAFDEITNSVTDYTKSIIDNAKETVSLRNESELAAVKVQGLIEEYDRQAEKLRQVRDDESKTFEERIDANNRLGEVLKEQEQDMLKLVDIQIASAQADVDKNNNLENQIKLQQALNEKKGVLAQITGFESEQLTNNISLQKEQQQVAEENAEAQLEAFSGLANALSGLAAENKELAVAGAIIDTYAGANAALKAGAGTPLGFIQAAAIIAAGLANVQKILSVPVAGATGGGGGIAAQTPAPQMTSGAFDLSGGVAPEPVQAFVLTDDMTNSQNQLANIRRRATI